MTTWPAGPYTVEIDQVTTGFVHTLSLNCDTVGVPDIGSAPAAVQLESQSGIGVNLDVAVNAFWALFRPMYSTQTLASGYTLWKHNTFNSEKVFISAGTLSSQNGSNASAPVLAGQFTLTWRSAKGNVMKIVAIEGSGVGSTRTPILNTGDPAVATLNTYILGNTNWIMARDRSFPVIGMNGSYGQNEVIFNRRFRS